MIHQDQQQHRISQVYLREWSFKDKRKADTLCIMKKGNPVAYPQHVKTFTTDKNLFDTTVHDDGAERYFDKKCNIVETNYNKMVLSALAENRYDGQTRIYLTEFISNLFVRQTNTYYFITSILEKKFLREKLLNEITLFEKEQDISIVKEVYKEISIDITHPIDSRVSATIVLAWKHFNQIMQRFNHVILKAPSNLTWYTLDNPVIVKNFGNDAFVLGVNAEVYFPISKTLLIYMYAASTTSTYNLEKLPNDEITQVSFEVFNDIMINTICKADGNYFILDEKALNYNAASGEFETKYIQINRNEPIQKHIDLTLMATPGAPRNDDLEQLLLKLNAEFEPTIVEVDTHPEAIENECIKIVDKVVNEKGGRRILGWLLRAGPYMLEAEFHAVWETSSGGLKDIAFKKEKTSAVYFVEDERLKYEGKQINNVRVNVYKIPIVDDFIKVANQEFRLLNKGKRALLYGKELDDALTPDEVQNISDVKKLKNFILTFINDGGQIDNLCPCNSGRKYKNCHREKIKGLARLE